MIPSPAHSKLWDTYISSSATILFHGFNLILYQCVASKHNYTLQTIFHSSLPVPFHNFQSMNVGHWQNLPIPWCVHGQLFDLCPVVIPVTLWLDSLFCIPHPVAVYFFICRCCLLLLCTLKWLVLINKLTYCQCT